MKEQKIAKLQKELTELTSSQGIPEQNKQEINITKPTTCLNCGSPVSDYMIYCQNCGKKLTD